MRKLLTLSVMLVMLAMAADAGAQDSGVPDTLKVIGDTLVVGQSRPIQVTIVNDYPVGAILVGFLLQTTDGGWAEFDSAVYVNRMADPTVLDFRFAGYEGGDLVSPDTLKYGGYKIYGNSLPVGNTAVANLYFTGISSGGMVVDSVRPLPTKDFSFVEDRPYPYYLYTPQFIGCSITVIERSLPPVLTLPSSWPQVAAGSDVSFDISAVSPTEAPVSVQIVELTGYDSAATPVNQPGLSGTDPVVFDWSTASADVGIWEVTIEACDSAGLCTSGSLMIQVVVDDDYMVPFEVHTMEGFVPTTDMVGGDFDGDSYPEIMVSGSGQAYTSPLSTWDFDPNEEIYTGVWSLDWKNPVYAAAAAYMDQDGDLDAVLLSRTGVPGTELRVALGAGNNSFGFFEATVSSVEFGRRFALCELNRDNFLDCAVTSSTNVIVYAGGTGQTYTLLSSITVGEQVLSIDAADFSSDGYVDLAVGTVSGISIYLNNGSGSFTLADSYSQTYGSVDVEITNQGSDFNDDNVYDLCISTPSIGGEYGEIVTYFGAGDGSFDQTLTRTVKGQVLGNVVGDFNDDGELDIAFVNGARKYMGILFGDGTGGFVNELRYSTGDYYPLRLVALDADLDGDMDLAVAGKIDYYNYGLLLFLNRLDPPGLMAMSFETAAMDNAELEIASPRGKVINKVKNSISAASYYQRDLDANDHLDNYTTLNAVENGAYSIKATPRPNLAVGENFSLEYAVNGESYRLAKDAPMSAAGYEFEVYPAGPSPISPASGKFTYDNPVSFSWVGTGSYNFQMATDLEFDNPVVDVVVPSNSYVSPTLTGEADTVTYYWRVKSIGSDEFGSINPVNVVFLTPTPVPPENNPLPGQFSLTQNYPNPFNPVTEIKFALPEAADVTLEVFNIVGQRVAVLMDCRLSAGEYSVEWSGDDGNGQSVATGIYLYRLEAGSFVDVKKMVLLK